MEICIVGASARAAAFSARRAGFQVCAADLFCDRDLKALCQVLGKISPYPEAALAIIKNCSAPVWMYTGALENYPKFLKTAAKIKPLWGTEPRYVRSVRDPRALFEILNAAGLPALPVCTSGIAPASRWVEKPLRSAGGQHIKRLAPGSYSPAPGNYLQQFAAGEPQGAVFVANTQHQVRLLGVSNQLLGGEEETLFRYAGSLGPLCLGASAYENWMKLASVIARAFHLVGLFGIDAILTDGQLWPVEVNPRYTASVEILERGTGMAALAFHKSCCTGGPLPEVHEIPSVKALWGKKIVFSKSGGWITARLDELIAKYNHDPLLPMIADIPQVGEEILPGHPVATVFATGESEEDILAQLAVLKREVLLAVSAAGKNRLQ